MTPTHVPDHTTVKKVEDRRPLPWWASMKTRLAVMLPLAALVFGVLLAVERQAEARVPAAELEVAKAAPADLTFKDLEDTTVSCTTTATVIQPGTLNRYAQSMQVQNTSATAVRIGGSGVTATTGIELCDGCAANQLWQGNVSRAYCIVASGSVTVEVAFARR